jgi:hypothetical protein
MRQLHVQQRVMQTHKSKTIFSEMIFCGSTAQCRPSPSQPSSDYSFHQRIPRVHSSSSTLSGLLLLGCQIILIPSDLEKVNFLHGCISFVLKRCLRQLYLPAFKILKLYLSRHVLVKIQLYLILHTSLSMGLYSFLRIFIRISLIHIHTILTMSRGSSGSIVSDYGLEDRAIEVRSPTGADFSSSPCVRTGTGAHLASYPMGTGGPFPGSKARPGRDADNSPPSSAEVKNE